MINLQETCETDVVDGFHGVAIHHKMDSQILDVEDNILVFHMLLLLTSSAWDPGHLGDRHPPY